LPPERRAITHKFSIGGHEGYLTVGMYEDGQPGELFIVISKEGSTISGLMDNFATSVSLALQYGVPLKVLVDKFSHSRFEPSGFTGNPKLPIAKSITDYIFRWLEQKFLLPGAEESRTLQPIAAGEAAIKPALTPPKEANFSGLKREKTYETAIDAPACINCGSITVRSGSCYLCPNCGTTSGCS
jgi:ribonucleoside-diphosphate reductase alpha chain